MKIPYITINWDKYQRRIVVGVGVYRLGVGRVFWCDKWKALFDFWPIL